MKKYYALEIYKDGRLTRAVSVQALSAFARPGI
jgi:hypothetical protein